MIDLIPNVTRPFFLPKYKDAPNAPTFHLRALTGKFILSLQGLTNIGEALWLTVLASLVKVDNVSVGGVAVEVTPQPERHVYGVKIEAGSASEEVVDQLPPEWLALIAAEVSDRHTVTPDDLGK